MCSARYASCASPQWPAGFAELVKVRGLTCEESYHDQSGHFREKMVWDFDWIQ
jgi:hypothetical protein